MILCSIIGCCKTEVKKSNIGFNCQEPSVTGSAWLAVPVSWQRNNTGPEDLTVVHGWIGNLAKDLEMSGPDGVIGGQF